MNNLDYLKESLAAHKHIVVHLAAIVRRPDLYIFLPYTELGSLEVFLCKGVDESHGTNRQRTIFDFDTHFPSDNLQPHHMLRQMLNLCSALDFLHDRLQIGQGRIYCAHMDLRPQNILIFASSEAGPVGRWKISDFGISSFKKFQNTKEQTYLSIRDLAEIHTSIPTDRNIEGAHRSPENHGSHKGSYSGRKSDMWSYACVLVEVLAFALGSNHLLSEFRKLKVQGDEDGNDAFFTMKISASADGSNECSVKLSVLDWLKVLGKRFLEDRLWVDDLVKLILAVLRIVPEERLTAQEVYAKFGRILEHHFQSIDSDNGPLPNEESKAEDSSNYHDRKHRFGVWKFELPGPQSTVKAWCLSPFGDRAAFLLKYPSYSVHVFSIIDEDKNSTMKIIDELPPGVDWQTLKIANHYLSVVGWQSKLGTQVKLSDHMLVNGAKLPDASARSR